MAPSSERTGVATSRAACRPHGTCPAPRCSPSSCSCSPPRRRARTCSGPTDRPRRRHPIRRGCGWRTRSRSDYAAQNGWADACAGREIHIDVYPDLDAVQGRPVVAYADLGGSCSMAVEEAQLHEPGRVLRHLRPRAPAPRARGRLARPGPGPPAVHRRAAVRAVPRRVASAAEPGEAVARVRARVGAGWRLAVVGRPDGDEAAYLVRRRAAARTGAGCSVRSSRSGATATARRPRSPAWRSGPRGRPAPAAP